MKAQLIYVLIWQECLRLNSSVVLLELRKVKGKRIIDKCIDGYNNLRLHSSLLIVTIRKQSVDKLAYVKQNEIEEKLIAYS